MGLCPLHLDHKPSFLVDPIQNLFYCYGCGRGGDLIRFVELYRDVSFSEAMALLRRSARSGSLLSDVARFYQLQLDRHPEAVAHLQRRVAFLLAAASQCRPASRTRTLNRLIR